MSEQKPPAWVLLYVLAAAERILAERDTGKPDPMAWIDLRNAVRAARAQEEEK